MSGTRVDGTGSRPLLLLNYLRGVIIDELDGEKTSTFDDRDYFNKRTLTRGLGGKTVRR